MLRFTFVIALIFAARGCLASDVESKEGTLDWDVECDSVGCIEPKELIVGAKIGTSLSMAQCRSGIEKKHTFLRTSEGWKLIKFEGRLVDACPLAN